MKQHGRIACERVEDPLDLAQTDMPPGVDRRRVRRRSASSPVDEHDALKRSGDISAGAPLEAE